MDQSFWTEKRLHEMSPQEWESLCDGCGLCCTIKLEDEDTGAIADTSLACALLESETCRCGDYENRQARVPGCLRLTPQSVPELSWLPKTCAYGLVARGEALPEWHPLISGDPESVHRAGVSVRGRVISEDAVPEWDWEDYVIRVVNEAER